jgi:HPt (histidine-containing phosphotransfer) domain-containing protein
VVEQLLELPDVGPSGLLELVDAFADDAVERYAQLRAAARTGNRATLGSLAHALKGSCGMFGAVQAHMICAELQDRAPELGGDAVAQLVDDLGPAIDRAVEALRERLGQQGPTG